MWEPSVRTESIIMADPLPLGVEPTMLDLSKPFFESSRDIYVRSGLIPQAIVLESDNGYGMARCGLTKFARTRDERCIEMQGVKN